MQSRLRKTGLTIASVALGGYMMATGGCLSYLGEQVIGVADVCFIIDCTDGLSGLLDPCTANDPLFLDCPDNQP